MKTVTAVSSVVRRTGHLIHFLRGAGGSSSAQPGRQSFRAWLAAVVWLAGVSGALAQTFVGTNQPNSGTNFTFALAPGTTNLSLVVSNTSSAYSQLFLKAGGDPTDIDFGFASRLTGRGTNAINLEWPEFAVANYGLRVQTPAASAAHNFRVVLTTNRTDLRTAAYPVLKPVVFSVTGSLTSGAWHYFQVDMPTNLPGWRLALSATDGDPNLYVRRGQLPTTSAYDKAGTGLPVDTVVLTGAEATSATYFIGVHLPSGAGANADYVLTTELGYLTELEWDPGLTHRGTKVFTNSSPTGGDYFFKVNPQNTAVGAWRTALNVHGGEANLYLRRGSFSTRTNDYSRVSARSGSDGFMLHSSEFAAAQEWHMLVRATAGAQWDLVSGEAFVHDLGLMAPPDSTASSTNVPVGAEGMVFFKTKTTIDTQAWRLGLNGAASDLLVKKSVTPHPRTSSAYDLKQAAQMLVVPDYLAAATFDGYYFVGVSNAPGTLVNLDSRQQAVVDIPIGSATNLAVTGFGYLTYRVQVPVNQIAWQIETLAALGNPNVCVRREKVPNEWNNDAFSEVTGLANDSVAFSPPTLSDGTFFITVYGLPPYTCTLTNGPPIITDIDYASTTVNDLPQRVGWRFYRAYDIAQQLGSLGWDLILQNQPPKTEIAVRRNAVPSRWQYRSNDSPIVHSSGHVDDSSTDGFLQRPGHQADIWYVGVYNPTNALGAFTLIAQPIPAEVVAFDGATASRANVPANRIEYFRVDVPTNALGWDVRLVNVTRGEPRLSVRRDLLPSGLGTGPWITPQDDLAWASGYTWGASRDWTDRYYSADGEINEYGRILACGIGRPLEPGTYYVGVVNSAGESPMSYTVLSRGIGDGLSLPVRDLPFAGGTATNLALPAREADYYRTFIPGDAPGWKVKLTVNSGEAMLVALEDCVPNVLPELYSTASTRAGLEVQKLDDEHLVLLPPAGQSTLTAGTYYLAVVSEGQNVTNSIRIGAGTSAYVLESLGALPIVDLGTLYGEARHTNSLESGELSAYQFTIPTNTLSLETVLEERVGNPYMTQRAEDRFSYPAADGYGVAGGGNAGSQDHDASIITVANPAPGVFRLIVKANKSDDEYPPASYVLRVTPIGYIDLAFDGGSHTVANQMPGSWRYFRVQVPAEAQGWDVRLTNVLTGSPRLVIVRDLLPDAIATLTASGASWYYPYAKTNWPSGYQWAPFDDWTGRDYSAAGTNEIGRVFADGMGNPLEPGTYVVGVASSDAAQTLSYTISSRGIGAGLALPIVPLAFTGGTATVTNLPAREAAYYRIDVPPDTLGWSMKLRVSTGDAMLAVQKDTPPNIEATDDSGDFQGGQVAQKTGDEHLVLLADNGATFLAPGPYYVAVISEGMNPTRTAVGSNGCSAAFQSVGPVPIRNLGTLTLTPATWPDTLEGGETKAYQVEVPPGTDAVEIQLKNRTGNPWVAAVQGSALPDPSSGTVTGDGGYGAEDGQTADRFIDDNVVTVPNPAPGTLSFTVKAHYLGPDYAPATCTVQVRAVAATPIAFDGGSSVVADQMSESWSFFRVDVPTTALGWDVRLANVTSGTPRLVVRRDLLPRDLSTRTASRAPWQTPQDDTAWPTGYQWHPGEDWTRRPLGPTGLSEESTVFIAGLGNPLEPGTYYVGVVNETGTNTMSYTFLSRGIGEGMALPPMDVDFAGGSAARSGLTPRDVAFYRVQIPENTPSWQVRLACYSGDATLVVQKDTPPNIGADRAALGLAGGRLMHKDGNEHYALLPANGQSLIPAGTYYLAVASDGVNPAGDQIGTGGVDCVIESRGLVPLVDLGVVSDVTVSNALEGGELVAYQFVLEGAASVLEARFEGQVGNPYLGLMQGARLPSPNPTSSDSDPYGLEGGQTTSSTRWLDSDLVTVPNPAPGLFSLVVKAHRIDTLIPDAAYTLRIFESSPPRMAFSANLNTPAVSNWVSGLLANDQRVFYEVIVPATNQGQAVIGWKLNVTQDYGAATIRAKKDLLPSDSDINGMPFVADQAILVPPFLSPGHWYIEVKGSGATAFTLTSTQLLLERPPWQMQEPGQPSPTPGLTAPEFADTGLNADGVPLPNDQGVDLAEGEFHYYALVVPANNGGLLRMVLEAINGNPDLYLRVGAPPTLSHGLKGRLASGSLVERQLTATGTQYADWVPLSTRYESGLTDDLWYLAVRAGGGSNVRYRLRLSTGNVQDLALDGGSFTNQTVAAGDWRYYRVQIPLDAPPNWHVNFLQHVGDAVMYVRDTAPPGHGRSLTSYCDWATDDKNRGDYPNFDDPGAYPLTVPPVRPGHTYYLGFRAKNDATFSLDSSISGGTIAVTNLIAFYGGTLTTVLPPFGQLLCRIDVPADAWRWIHTSVHASAVRVYLDQGSLPKLTTSDHWHSGSVANSTLNKYLRAPNGWPWLPGYSYFLAVTNTSNSAQPFSLAMDGRNASNDDNDGDGLLDAWEIYYFGNITAQNGTGDPDGDFVKNLDEFQENTDPTNPNDFNPRLTIIASGGSVAVGPAWPYYPPGYTVTLITSANPGFVFKGWNGDAVGDDDPLYLTLDGHKTVTALFVPPNDNFANRIVLAGSNVALTAHNTNATKEAFEPNHAGNAGGKSVWWTWTAPAGGYVTNSTTGSSFDTTLAVYTGDSLAALDLVAQDNNSGSGSSSRVIFHASAGITYQIAVDGYKGAFGSIVLTLRHLPESIDCPPGDGIVQAASVAAATGLTGNGDSVTPALTPDGGVLAFASGAPDLVPGDANGAADIFALDLGTGALGLVSVPEGSAEGANGPSTGPLISADAHYVIFESLASNLVSSDLNGQSDIFVRDLAAGTTRLVSVNDAGTGSGNDSSYSPATTPDAQVIVFESLSSDLAPGDTNSGSDVFWRDLSRATNVLVSLNADGTSTGNQPSCCGSVSADGRFVVFESAAADLVPDDMNGAWDVFVRDMVAGTTVLVSINRTHTGSGNDASYAAAISPDGRYVAYTSAASDLVSGDANFLPDVYLYDRLTGSNRLASVNHRGTASGQGASLHPSAFSANSRVFAFLSEANDLVALDDNPGVTDLFAHDALTGANTLVSARCDGAGGGSADSGEARLSADGRFVAFQSHAADLVAGDLNGAPDVFLRDLVSGTTFLVSRNPAGTGTGNRGSTNAVLSADGSRVAFASEATDLVPDDLNGLWDVFVWSGVALPSARFLTPAMLPDGAVQLDVIATEGVTFRIQVSTNLVDWTTVTTQTSSGGLIRYTDRDTSHVHRFYRALTP